MKDESNMQGEQIFLGMRLESHAQLDDYVGSAAEKLKQLEGLVLVCGKPGTGKSHLLQGLCRDSQRKGEAAIYLPSSALREPDLLHGLEQMPLACIDDIAPVLARPAWQEALFHFINSVRDRGGKLVIASSVPLAELHCSLPDLGSRLRGAQLVVTDDLRDADKLEVIRLKAHRLGFEMNEEVCQFILSRARRDMHHLSRLVAQLDRNTLLRQKRVTIPFVKAELGL